MLKLFFSGAKWHKRPLLIARHQTVARWGTTSAPNSHEQATVGGRILKIRQFNRGSMHACPGAAVRFLNVAKTPSCCQKTRKTWATLFVPTLKPHFGFQWTVFNECPYSLFSFYGQLSNVLLSVLLFSQEAERLKLFLMDGSDDSAWSSLWSPDTQSSVSWLTVTFRLITTDRNNFMSHLFK